MNSYVLAGVDGSSESTAAARWAAAEAVRRGLALRLVHVRTWLDDTHGDPGQPGDVRALTSRMLSDTRQAVLDAHPGLEVGAELIGDTDAVEPLASALAGAAGGAELLVLGSRGLGGFTGLLVGSVGLAVAGRCEVPSVFVRAGGSERPGGSGRPEVVVGVDTRAPSREVVEFAFREAARRGTVLRAVHGWEPPPVWGYAGWVPPLAEAEQFRAIERELLTVALADRREEFPEVEVVEDCRIGTGSSALVEASAEASVVVVGRRRHPHRAGLRLGPVAHAVLHHAQAPVVIVPHD
ncbi:universal stress protein [Kitasatospora sp. NPDC057541]|uniref:universal stress protein n=1 Tax=unclassified Kitasatospora TaxID=2633591 RepID=UPI0036B9DC14